MRVPFSDFSTEGNSFSSPTLGSDFIVKLSGQSLPGRKAECSACLAECEDLTKDSGRKAPASKGALGLFSLLVDVCEPSLMALEGI